MPLGKGSLGRDEFPVVALGDPSSLRASQRDISTWKWCSTPEDFAVALEKYPGRSAGVVLDDQLVQLAAESIDRYQNTPFVCVIDTDAFQSRNLARFWRRANVDFEPSGIPFRSLLAKLRLMRLKLASLKRDPGDPFNVPPATESLYNPQSHRLDASRIADLYGIPQRQIAKLLRLNPQTLHKTPDSKQAHKALAPYERAARALMRLKNDPEKFRQWLNSPLRDLDDQTPMEVIERGKINAVADMVESALVGEPS
jgi:hypothetical protein